MKCVTGKNGYYNEDEVQEALIRSHIRFPRAAVNYYLCQDCGEYHLTSQGERHPILDDPQTRQRIQREQQEQDWLARFRK